MAAILLAPLQCFAAKEVQFMRALSVYAGNKGVSLNHPEGVACQGNEVMVADTVNGRLVRYTLKGGKIGGGNAIKVSQITYPIRLHLDSKGDIFVLDGKTRNLYKLDPKGKFLGPVKPTGLPAGPAPILRSFALDGKDNIYLLDVFGERVIVLDKDGKFQRQIAFPKDVGFISDLCVGPTGTIYLLDSVDGKLYSVSPGSDKMGTLVSDLKQYLTFATGIYSGDDGTLFVVDHNGSGIVMLGPDGSYEGRQLTMGWKPGLLYYPSQICLTNDNEAVIADQGNSRVQIFKLKK